MRTYSFLAGLTLGAALIGAPKNLVVQIPDGKVTRENLRATLENMGYEVKDLGQQSEQITLTRSGDSIYIACSVSGSGQEFWITAYFGELTKSEQENPAFLLSILRKNRSIQPTQFYLNKNALSVGYAIANRSLTPAVIRASIDLFADNVHDCKDFWVRKD